MILAIGGIFFLSLLILNVNTSTGNRIIEVASNEAVIQATGIAEGIFEEIQSRAFDEETVSKPIDKANKLTVNVMLGKDTTENLSTSFDDIDDYNNYLETFNSSGMGDFDVRVNVYYVKEDDPDYESTVRTFLKRVRVTIENQYLPVTLTFYRLVSY